MACIAVESSAVLSSFVVKLAYVGSDLTGAGCQILPRPSWPQGASITVNLEYDDP